MRQQSVDEIFRDFETESRVRLANNYETSRHVEGLWGMLIDTLDGYELQEAMNARRFIESISYKHVGLTSDRYLFHPLRVAAIAGLFSSFNRLAIIQVALLHNIFEVSDIDSQTIITKFDQSTNLTLCKLKIDREKQGDNNYLASYYAELSNLPNGLGIVKTIDKLDNLFTLNETADKKVRDMYLKEVDEYVLPLSDTTNQIISEKIRETVSLIKEKCV